MSIAWLVPGQHQRKSAPTNVISPEDYMGKAYQYVENRRYAEAAQEFRAALSLNPHLAQARYEMAICEFAVGRLEDARRQFLQVRRETSGTRR
jgi:Flp pilus assembly protein TadD